VHAATAKAGMWLGWWLRRPLRAHAGVGKQVRDGSLTPRVKLDEVDGIDTVSNLRARSSP
jgi:hypothetical protein